MKNLVLTHILKPSVYAVPVAQLKSAMPRTIYETVLCSIDQASAGHYYFFSRCSSLLMIGETLGHYRILRQIGAGGMGVVYLAHDERLEREVAVKVLPSTHPADELDRKRFRREAFTLSRLNHPNVATIFDFDTDGETDFLVTEYIKGVGLDEKLATGPLPTKEAIGLGIQLAQGLAAAHGQNIVHRDLKPANLRLTADGRLKVLDFGLARLVHHEEDVVRTMSLTSSQQVTGTLPYMSPEQLRGESVDSRTDIWAAGVVLYEMTTGKRPFPERNGPMLINSILNDQPPAPSRANPKVPIGLQSIILKALEKDPALRYQSSRELAADLERLTAGTFPLAAVSETEFGRPVVIAVVVSVLLVLAIAGYFFTLRPKPSVTQPVNTRRSVAVLGFKNLSGRADTAWVSIALAEMLTTELAAGEKLLTISGENVARVKNDLAVPETDTLAPDTLSRVRGSLGSDYIVLGSYLDLGGSADDQIRLDLRLQDAVAGQTIALVSDKGNLSQLDELVTRAGAMLRSKLGVGEISPTAELAARAMRPANVQAARLYSQGLEKLRTGDALAARDLFLQSVAADPNHADSYAALAAAWNTLGYDSKSQEAAKQAFKLASKLPREDRLRFEGQSYEADSQWEQAIASYRALFELEPDNLDYGLKLANTQIFAGKATEALETLARLRNLPSPRNEDLRIDLTEARAAHFLSDFKREHDIAVSAAQKGEKQGARFLVARARMAECLALRNMGNPKRAIPACQEAQRVFALAGDRFGVANALNSIGNALYDVGDLDAARKTYEQAIQISREIGNLGGLAGALDNLGSLVGDQGDEKLAKKLSREALAIYRETGDKMNLAATLNNIGSEMVVNGDLTGGQKLLEESLAIGREIGSDSSIATSLVNLGEVRLDLGDTRGARAAYEGALALFQKNNEKGKSAYPLVGLGEALAVSGDLRGARKNLEQALAIANEISEKHESAIALSAIGRVLLLQGETSAARERFAEALALRKELDEKDAIADSTVDLARVSLAEQRPAEAEQAINKVLSGQNPPDLEAYARSSMAQALIAQNKFAEARKQVSSARAAAGRTHRRRTQLDTEITAATVQAASGRAADVQAAVRSLNRIILQCQEIGFQQYGLQAKLALAEIEMRQSNSQQGRERLKAVEKEAQEMGFGLLAERAAQTSK